MNTRPFDTIQPGYLSRDQAAEINRAMREVERLSRLSVTPPLMQHDGASGQLLTADLPEEVHVGRGRKRSEELIEERRRPPVIPLTEIVPWRQVRPDVLLDEYRRRYLVPATETPTWRQRSLDEPIDHHRGSPKVIALDEVFIPALALREDELTDRVTRRPVIHSTHAFAASETVFLAPGDTGVTAVWDQPSAGNDTHGMWNSGDTDTINFDRFPGTWFLGLDANVSNRYEPTGTTTLDGDIDDVTDTLTVDFGGGSGWPPGGQFAIQIDSEIIYVEEGGEGDTTWSVSRGQENTTAAAHTSGASIELITSTEAPSKYVLHTSTIGELGRTYSPVDGVNPTQGGWRLHSFSGSGNNFSVTVDNLLDYTHVKSVLSLHLWYRTA